MEEQRVIRAVKSDVGVFQIDFIPDGIMILTEKPTWVFLKEGDLLTLKLGQAVPDDGVTRISNVCTDLLGQTYTKNRVLYRDGVPQNIDPWLKKTWFFPAVTMSLEKIVISGRDGPVLPLSVLSEKKLKIEQYAGSTLCLGNKGTKEEKEFQRVSISLFDGSDAIFPGAKIHSLKVWCFGGSLVDDCYVVKEYKLHAEKKSKIFITASADCVELEKNALGCSEIYVRR